MPDLRAGFDQMETEGQQDLPSLPLFPTTSIANGRRRNFPKDLSAVSIFEDRMILVRIDPGFDEAQPQPGCLADGARKRRKKTPSVFVSSSVCPQTAGAPWSGSGDARPGGLPGTCQQCGEALM